MLVMLCPLGSAGLEERPSLSCVWIFRLDGDPTVSLTCAGQARNDSLRVSSCRVKCPDHGFLRLPRTSCNFTAPWRGIISAALTAFHAFQSSGIETHADVRRTPAQIASSFRIADHRALSDATYPSSSCILHLVSSAEQSVEYPSLPGTAPCTSSGISPWQWCHDARPNGAAAHRSSSARQTASPSHCSGSS